MLTKCLEPKEYFKWFEAISKIPRESHKEQRITAFVAEFFKERGIACEVDGVGNVFARLPATPGYEDQPAILYQAHMDMVCRKDEGVEFDFDNDPIRLVIDGDLLRAEGTTLGADNAVGMATMLAIADDPKLPHPALELLFTVCEEQGMIGIKNFDFSKIKARRMINMDCGDSHVIAICSTGRINGMIEKQYTLTPVTEAETVLQLKLHGGLSGHASICANKGRSCAVNTVGYLLLGAEDVRLCDMYGTGPIIKDCTVTVAVPRVTEQEIVDRLQKRFADYKKIYEDTDPGIMLSIEKGNAELAADPSCTQNLALLLSTVRTGQITAEGNDPATVRSLSIICLAKLDKGAFQLEYLVRSTCAQEQERIWEYYRAMCTALGFEMMQPDRQPVWKENPDSAFRAKFQRVHTAMFGEPLETERVPGGIEVVHIVNAIPDMDAAGIAPTARGAHTTKEHLYISQVKPYWDLMKAMLADKE